MKSILLAEDEPHVSRMMKIVLEGDGYSVTTASNGEEALRELQRQQPDVLITDIAMPRMTGQQLCEWINANMPDRQFTIFVVTSRTELEHREWSAAIDNLMFLEKPVSTRKLTALLRDHFLTQQHSG